MPAFTPAHSSPFARLTYNVDEAPGRLPTPCWIGTESSKGRGGYVQVNFRVPGMGGRIVKFSAHLLTWIAHETQFTHLDDLFLAYREFRASGLELDHRCQDPRCRRPGHLQPLTHSENCLLKYQRTPISHYEPDEVPF